MTACGIDVVQHWRQREIGIKVTQEELPNPHTIFLHSESKTSRDCREREKDRVTRLMTNFTLVIKIIKVE